MAVWLQYITVKNPFNGIERAARNTGYKPLQVTGIHSMELKGLATACQDIYLTSPRIHSMELKECGGVVEED